MSRCQFLRPYFIYKRLTFFLFIALITIFYLFNPQRLIKGVEESLWQQTDWSGGSSQESWNDSAKYLTSQNIDNSRLNEISLSHTLNWYDQNWQYRKKITFDNSTQSQDLLNFPVLIRLVEGSNIDYSKTQNNGQDIRFTDSDGTTLLSYEIESWNESGDSFVWVKVPQINGNSNLDSIYMYYGNVTAQDAQTKTAVWTDNYKAVWHLKENPTTSAPQIKDSTSNNLHGTAGGLLTVDDQVQGKINGSLNIDTGDYVDMGDQPLLELQPPFTISAWINIDALPSSDDYAIINKRSNNSGWEWTWQMDAEVLYFFKQNSSSQGTYFGNIPISPDDIGNWTHVMITIDSLGNHASYKNGIQTDSGTITNTNIKTSSGTVRIGGMNYYTYNKWYNGKFDEITVSSSNRSSDWVQASYKSQSDTFNTYLSEEGIFQPEGTLTSSIFDSTYPTNWGTLTYQSSGQGTVSVKVRTGNLSNLSDAPDFSSCSTISSDSDISDNNCVSDRHRFIQYQVALQGSKSDTPSLTSINISYSEADIASPILSQLTSSPDQNQATIIWSTDEPSTTQLNYGLTSSLGTTSPTDVPQTTSHSVTLSSLLPCTLYYYQAVSQDAESNESTSSTQSFTTTGCNSNSQVIQTQTASILPTGGSLSLGTDGKLISLIVPSDFSSTETTFQIKQLDQDQFFTAVEAPPSLSLVGSQIFNLQAYTNIDQSLTSFDSSLTVSISYRTDDITNIDEDSLKIYHYDGSSWHVLSDITIDTINKTVSGTTTSFSDFGLFGQFSTSQNNQTNISSQSSNNPPSCQDSKSLFTSDLFEIRTTKTTAKLFFTPLLDTSDFFISFSEKSHAEEHGEIVNLQKEGVQSHTIYNLKSNTSYFIKVRGQNGCMPGDWSNIMKFTTDSKTYYKYYSPKTVSSETTIQTQITKTIFSSLETPTPIPPTTSPTQPTISLKRPYPTSSPKCFLWWCW